MWISGRFCFRRFMVSMGGNAEELAAFRVRSWVRLLEAHAFGVKKAKKTLLYAPLGDVLLARNVTLLPPFLRLEKVTGLCSSIAFFAGPS